MTHLTRDELERWWRDGSAAQRDRVLAHLAECDECGTAYGEIIDADPLPPDAAAVRDAAPRGYRTYRRPGVFGLDWSSPRVLAACGAAAAAVLALVVPSLRETTTHSDARAEIRGTSLQPLAPIGTVALPVEFRWASPVIADRYRVEIRDERSGELLVRIESDAASVPLAPEQLSRLRRGLPYSWVVIAVDPDGVEIMRAPPRSFVVSDSER
jgi:hypothetical protein